MLARVAWVPEMVVRNQMIRFGRARATLINTPGGQKKFEGSFNADLTLKFICVGQWDVGLRFSVVVSVEEDKV